MTLNNSKSEEGQGDNSVHFPLLSLGEERGVEPPTNFQKIEDLTGPQFLEGAAGKEEVTFFSGGL